MSNRALWICLIGLGILAALGAVAYAAYESLEAQLVTRLVVLRASTSDLEPDRSPTAHDLSARVDAIDRWVRDNTTKDDPFGPPWLRSAEEVVDLPARLDGMGEFFGQVDALTASEGCRRVLERGVYLDMPTRRLMFARTRTNLLCARAWVDQRVAGDSAAAVRRLGQALDLARLGDDGRAIGLLIDVTNEQAVLFATQEILRDPRCDAVLLHEQLDARLARMSEPDRLRRALFLDFVSLRERIHGKGVVGLVQELRYLDGLERAMTLAGVPGVEAEPVIRSLESSPNRYDSAWCVTVKSWQLARTHSELCRAALAIAARSTDPLPVDPYSNEPFARETTPDGERIFSPAAIRSTGNPDKPYLLSWTVPR